MRYKPRKFVKYKCSNCNAEYEGQTAMPGTLLGSFARFCPCCNEYAGVPLSKNKKADNKKRSKDQERRGSKRHGARLQPASGALAGAKSDAVVKDDRRIEFKETIHRSFTVKLDVLQKIEAEAVLKEQPLLEVEFQCVHPYRRYVVIPDWVYDDLKAKAGLNK